MDLLYAIEHQTHRSHFQSTPMGSVFRLFKTMASSPKSRKVFVDSALSFVRLYKFDGLDIDWEYPQGPEDKKNFGLLMKVRRAGTPQSFY